MKSKMITATSFAFLSYSYSIFIIHCCFEQTKLHTLQDVRTALADGGSTAVDILHVRIFNEVMSCITNV